MGKFELGPASVRKFGLTASLNDRFAPQAAIGGIGPNIVLRVGVQLAGMSGLGHRDSHRRGDLGRRVAIVTG